MLPTVHQADAWVRQTMGANLGERAAAAAFLAQDRPSIAGCVHALAKLEKHSTRGSWPAAPRLRVLHLQEASAPTDDELLSLLTEGLTEGAAGAAAQSGWASPQYEGQPAAPPVEEGSGAFRGGTGANVYVLRAWAAVLQAPAQQWAPLLDASCLLERTAVRLRNAVAPALPVTPLTREWLLS